MPRKQPTNRTSVILYLHEEGAEDRRLVVLDTGQLWQQVMTASGWVHDEKPWDGNALALLSAAKQIALARMLLKPQPKSIEVA